jgi:hypothetical protein
MTQVMLINLALFLPVVAAGAAASWFGWKLAGSGAGDGGGGLGASEPRLPDPHWPAPVRPRHGVGRDDLARSA